MALAPLAQTLLITAGRGIVPVTDAVTVPSIPIVTPANTRANSTTVRANNSAFAPTFHSIEQRLAALGG